ncbi:MAG: 6-phosphogluconolactonase [Bacteroidales bacterium]
MVVLGLIRVKTLLIQKVIVYYSIMRIVISENITDSCQALTESMVALFKSIHGRDVYLAISGGSTPARLFDLWAYRYEHEIDWKRIQLFWVDERCVPPADKDSNYRMTVTHLISKLPFMEKHIHRIHGEANPEEEVMRYEEVTRKLLPWENGIPVFDLILLGIGTDGHTASIFPGDELPDPNKEDICNSITKSCLNSDDYRSDLPIYKVTRKPDSGQLRITMTLPLINMAKNVYFLATGAEKSKIISALFHQTPDVINYPAHYVNPIDGPLICFLDRAAVSDACISPK